MSATNQSLPPPPSDAAIPDILFRWLYLLYQYVLNISSGGSSGEFGDPGITEPNKALVPDDDRGVDYLNLDELSLDGVSVDSTAAEINQLHFSNIQRSSLSSLQSHAGGMHSSSFSIGTEAADVINVTLQVYNADGNATSLPVALTAYLSDSSTGLNVAAIAPTGGVAVGTSGFSTDIVAGKVFQLITDSSGFIDLNITDIGTPTFYLCVVAPYGSIKISEAITFA